MRLHVSAISIVGIVMLPLATIINRYFNMLTALCYGQDTLKKINRKKRYYFKNFYVLSTGETYPLYTIMGNTLLCS